jgi:hypothetical protein
MQPYILATAPQCSSISLPRFMIEQLFFCKSGVILLGVG